MKQWKKVYNQANRVGKAGGDREFANDQLPGWRCAIQKTINESLKAHSRWSALHDSLLSLETVYRGNEDLLSLSNKSPEAVIAQGDFERSLISFQNMSFTLAETIIAELKAEIEDKVPFNHYFDFRPQANDPNGLRIPRRTQILRTEISTGQRVGCIFEKFRSILEDYHRMRFGLSPLLGELDLVLDAELKRAIVDDDAEKHVSILPFHMSLALQDLGIFAKCIIQIDNFRPWSSVILPALEDRHKMSGAVSHLEELERPLKRLYSRSDTNTTEYSSWQCGTKAGSSTLHQTRRCLGSWFSFSSHPRRI